MSIHTLNIERGMPTVEVARKNLEQGIRTAKSRRTAVIKVIHGYGSSGKGGAIKRDVIQVLAKKQSAGEIRCFVTGENFSPFDASARKIIDLYPDLRRDSDYSRGNDGITIILI